MIYPNCSELVCRIDLPKKQLNQFNDELDKDITKFIGILQPYEYDKESNSDYVIYNEGEGSIYFRRRFDGSEEDIIDLLNPLLKKWKVKYQIVGDQDDRPLFSVDDNLFCLIDNKIKIFDIGFTNNKYANQVHKKILYTWRIK